MGFLGRGLTQAASSQPTNSFSLIVFSSLVSIIYQITCYNPMLGNKPHSLFDQRYSVVQTQAHSFMTNTPSTKSLKDHSQTQLLQNRLPSKEIQTQITHSNQREQQRLSRENTLLKMEIESLREENFNLRKQVQKYAKTSLVPIAQKTKQKKLSEKEIDLYKEIVKKLQERVDILLEENRNLKESNLTFQKKVNKIQETESLIEQIQRVDTLVKSLQEDVQKDDDEWELYKELLGAEKLYFKQIIDKLQFEIGCLRH